MVLLQKWPFFQLFFLGKKGQENVFYDILQRKIACLSYKNKKFKNWKKLSFFKWGYPMVLFQKWPFFELFFLGNWGQENVFYDILKRKNGFLGYKIKKFKKSKNWHFSKGVNPWFSSQNGHFSNFFFFTQCRPGKCILWYSRTKKRLSRPKKQELQKVENLTFFQRGYPMVLVKKWALFSTSFFRQYRQGKFLLWYSRTLKRLSRL